MKNNDEFQQKWWLSHPQYRFNLVRCSKLACFYMFLLILRYHQSFSKKKSPELVGLVGGLEHGFYDFPFSWEWKIIPTDFHSIIFQRGRSTTNQWCYPIIIPLLSHYYPIIIPLLFHYYPIIIPLLSHYYSIIIPLLSHYYSIIIPLLFHYYPIIIPLLSHYYSIIIPLLSHYYSIIIPLLFHYYPY